MLRSSTRPEHGSTLGSTHRSTRARTTFAALAALTACSPSVRDEIAAGDVALRSRDDGSFEVTVAGRVLLAAASGSVRLRQQSPRVDLLWGQYDYDPGVIIERRPSRRAAARVEGAALILELEGDRSTARLRVEPTPDRAGEYTVTVHAESPDPGEFQRASLALDFACDDRARFLGFGADRQPSLGSHP